MIDMIFVPILCLIALYIMDQYEKWAANKRYEKYQEEKRRRGY